MTSVVYSNQATTLIGYLVQKFSGVPYKQYIQEHVFTPLEMTSTAFRAATGYGRAFVHTLHGG